MKINNKFVFIITIILLVLVIGFKLYKDNLETNTGNIKNEILNDEEINSKLENISTNKGATEIIQNLLNNETTNNINNKMSNDVFTENRIDNEIKNNISNNAETKKENKPIKVTNENFEEIVLKSEKVVIVDFWAEWCSPCKYLSPILDELAKNRDDIIVAKINVDEEIELSNEYKITRIPTMLIFKNGEIKQSLLGVMSEDEILKYVDNIK